MRFGAVAFFYFYIMAFQMFFFQRAFLFDSRNAISVLCRDLLASGKHGTSAWRPAFGNDGPMLGL